MDGSSNDMVDKCINCGLDANEVELEPMPCCQALVCWDDCLQWEPTKCPNCSEGIEVTLKDPVTKESYVTPTWVREVST